MCIMRMIIKSPSSTHCMCVSWIILLFDINTERLCSKRNRFLHELFLREPHMYLVKAKTLSDTFCPSDLQRDTEAAKQMTLCLMSWFRGDPGLTFMTCWLFYETSRKFFCLFSSFTFFFNCSPKSASLPHQMWCKYKSYWCQNVVEQLLRFNSFG